jgi:hypothetical protein
MKGLYTALKCFMLEFWDLQQYAPTWNTTTLDYLGKLPGNAEAKCIHLPDSTRICQLKVCVSHHNGCKQHMQLGTGLL